MSAVRKIIVNGPFFFGETIELADGYTDDVCSFCADLCTANSFCSNRYHCLQGAWDIYPEGVKPQREEYTTEVISVCDQCWEQYDLGHYGNSPNVVVFYTQDRPLSKSPTFLLDGNFREND